MQDSKSVFGVLVGLFALFCLWLFASGNWGKLYAAVTGGTSSAAPSSTTAGAPAAVATGAPAQVTTVAPTTNYASGISILPLPTNPIGGGGGATSGGVSVTPSALNALAGEPVPGQTTAPNWLNSILGVGSTAVPA